MPVFDDVEKNHFELGLGLFLIVLVVGINQILMRQIIYRVQFRENKIVNYLSVVLRPLVVDAFPVFPVVGEDGLEDLSEGTLGLFLDPLLDFLLVL